MKNFLSYFIKSISFQTTKIKDTENSMGYGEPLATNGIDLDFRVWMSRLPGSNS